MERTDTALPSGVNDWDWCVYVTGEEGEGGVSMCVCVCVCVCWPACLTNHYAISYMYVHSVNMHFIYHTLSTYRNAYHKFNVTYTHLPSYMAEIFTMKMCNGCIGMGFQPLCKIQVFPSVRNHFTMGELHCIQTDRRHAE